MTRSVWKGPFLDNSLAPVRQKRPPKHARMQNLPESKKLNQRQFNKLFHALFYIPRKINLSAISPALRAERISGASSSFLENKDGPPTIRGIEPRFFLTLLLRAFVPNTNRAFLAKGENNGLFNSSRFFFPNFDSYLSFCVPLPLESKKARKMHRGLEDPEFAPERLFLYLGLDSTRAWLPPFPQTSKGTQKASSPEKIRKIWSRRSVIMPSFVGLTFQIHNGHKFNKVTIQESMIGKKFGALAPTRTNVASRARLGNGVRSRGKGGS